MLFEKYHISKIQSGEKTETRRAKKPRVIVGHLYKPHTTFMKKEKAGYIKILKIWKERLGEISNASARKEGCGSREAYFKLFKEINGNADLRRSIWVVRFKFQKTKAA